MARALTHELNQIVPGGYIVLIKPSVFSGKKYTKVWSEYWDVFLHKDKVNLSLEERKKHSNWIWHSIINDKVVFHVGGENVVEFVQTYTEPQNKNEIYVIKDKRKRNAKIQKKTSSNKRRAV